MPEDRLIQWPLERMAWDFAPWALGIVVLCVIGWLLERRKKK